MLPHISVHESSQEPSFRASPPDRPLAVWTWWFAVAVVLLVLNDWVLKSAFAGTWHSIWTGKLSTAAGAVLLPAWIQTVLVCGGVKRKAAASWAVGTAVVFLAGLEISLTVASITTQLNQILISQVSAGQVSLTADWSDLLTLPLCGVLLAWERIGSHF